MIKCIIYLLYKIVEVLLILKIRVMCSSSKAKMKSYASALSDEFKCRLVDSIPPAYPADKEKLVILCLSLKGEPTDELRRFCNGLYPNQSENVALLIDGNKDSRGYKVIKDALINTGTHIIENEYMVKCGIFGGKISADERKNVLEWANGIVDSISQ